jgi:hypothetical protein
MGFGRPDVTSEPQLGNALHGAGPGMTRQVTRQVTRQETL